ncbi:MAG: ABC transporter substrate-binding protein [Betaproteobacteria bacterium]|nr:ABC transporter substrate-binding protein [Betaproteobacteria bacterium]NBY34347.1 ABC transporter substrate-binding protein [Betaproteobacteria bacterium]NDF05323.1 ABC transporter substrate-binding protein [Betaproteobacteria bacterium]
MRTFLLCLGVWLSPSVWAAHAYAQFGDIKYPEGFSHFSYVNPLAPKGGDIAMVSPSRASSFDKYNPFTLKGTAPPGLGSLMLETLLTGNSDEPTTAYGLLAEDVNVAKDKLSVTFRLNPLARFHNGDSVLALDVKYSYDRLTSKEAAPQFRTYFSEVAGVVVVSEREIRFNFKRANAELPLIVGSMSVFSHKWGADKPLDKIITDVPIGSGPYKLGQVDFGKDIQYVRDKNYWAKNLNVRKGMFNFDHISYRLYKDTTAQFEGFKAGEFDYIQAFVAREWARGYKGKLFDNGTLIKKELQHGNAGDFQGFMFNTRLPKFKDARVRQAIGLAMDYEWMNRQLFYQAYTRVRGYFVGSDFEAKDLPDTDELNLLEPMRDKLDPAIFTQPVPLPPVTSLDPASGHTLRDHLRQARDLLAQAGWTYRDGALRNDKGEAFTLEFLDNSGSMGRVVTPYAKNLEKLGFKVVYKVVDFAVLQKRMDVFDFELISNRTGGSEAPGTELLERFGSKSADTEGSSNIIGVKDPAVDALLDKVVAAQTRGQLVAACKALDRVLRHGHYSVPHWYGSVHRVSWRAGRFEQPNITPRYYQPESWIQSTWWATPANFAGVR